MASIPPSTWGFAPTRASAPFPSNPLLFPPKRTGFLKLLPASSGEGAPEGEPEAPDPVKLAFAKAAAYRKSKPANPAPKPDPDLDPTGGSTGSDGDSGGGPDVPASVKLAMENAREYKKDKGIASASTEEPRDSALKQNPVLDPASGAKGSSDSGSVEVPASVKLAMEKAREYKKSNGITDASTEEPRNPGQEKMNSSNSSQGFLESKVRKKEELKISSTDFLGFDFSEKKRYRGPPPGLVPVVEPQGASPEVEIIVGDASKFQVTTPSEMTSNKDNDNIDLYKPKISTWGVFPRPTNISKTFGGGRVIRPGEVLETAEDKAAKEKRSRELISAYKNKMGLNIDAKAKAECEKALEEGDKLMDLGKLPEALPFYEKVMKDLVFQSELHGLAALQWSICQDSLRRSNEARVMYEKLQSHPNAQVSKKARQFMFSFQAMEMIKVTSSSYSRKTGYENYFEAFVENKVNYTPKEEEQDEDALRQGLPYIMFLVSPIFIVFLIAVRKSFQF